MSVRSYKFVSARRPAEVGASIADVDTPALLLDLDAFERNLHRMAREASRAGVSLRPHAKTHKSPAIALRQIEHGAVGVCCQTVSEAESMVAGGVADVLVSNEIVGRTKIDRLAALARHARIAVCVDDDANVAELSSAAQVHDSILDVLVELDVGARRCGVPDARAVLRLARLIATSPNLRFAGLQAYQGRAQHLREYAARRTAIDAAVTCCRETRDLLDHNDLRCKVITGGGTGTYTCEAGSGVYTEVQPGSYVFMDIDYGLNRTAADEPFRDFEHSLFVLTSVMSRVRPGVAVVDAGLKALAVDCGLPQAATVRGICYIRASDEHGTMTLSPDAGALGRGDKMMLIPGHCDPTVNLHEWYVGVRGNRVEALWPITARGPGL